MCVRFLFVCLFVFRLSLYALREGLVELTVGETLGNTYLVIYPQVVLILKQGTRDPDYRLQDTTVQTVTRAGYGLCLKVCVWSCVEIVSGTSKENCSWWLVHITRGKVKPFRVPSLGTLAKIVYCIHTEIYTVKCYRSCLIGRTMFFHSRSLRTAQHKS